MSVLARETQISLVTNEGVSQTVTEIRVEIIEPDSAEIWSVAAAQSATNAATSATQAASSATQAATQATNAGNSATQAASSATQAATQVGLAAAQVLLAEAEATDAANSASAALASKNAAQAAESAMTLLYDNFDDRYLGAKSIEPTTDNDGNAIIVGALYFDTATNEWRIWNGAAWQNAPFSIPGALLSTNNLGDVVNAAQARINLGLRIGVDVQAFSNTLALIAALSTTPFGRSLLTLADANALANAGLISIFDARYVLPSVATPPNAMWYGLRDSGDGRLLLDQVSPFEAINTGVNTWNLTYTDGAMAFGYLIALNIVNVGAAEVIYSYESTPEATAPTAIAWGLRDDNGTLILETLNPLAGQTVPASNWNMYFDTGALAYGAQGLFEIIPNVGAGIVLNY